MPDRAGVTRGWLAPIDRTSFRSGVLAMTPLGLAIGVWGVVTGVAIVNSGMPLWLGVIMTLTVYAGSAQLAVLPLLAVGTPLPVVWLTAMVVNLRFVIFAASSRSAFVGRPLRQRVFAGYVNGDLGFAMFTLRFSADPERGNPVQWGYFYGLAWVNWLVWQSSSVIGLFVGNLAPQDWGLGLAPYLALTAVLVPLALTVPAVAGVAAAVVVSVVAVSWPMRSGLLAAVVVGVVVALATEEARSCWRRRTRSAVS
jgi:predicted branched-subunit amino acid permease